MPPHIRERRSSVEVGAIAQFDNWDARECAVSNAGYWKEQVTHFISRNKGKPEIPRTIHQIWIGTREPPCVWLDSWRVNFSAGPGKNWEYRLWDNEAVANMRKEEELINGHLFDRERMWQCKADILRLELLYRFGGVYIDADMISLGKSIDHVLESARETGFGVSFEADTKDKPYSVLGNSIIFASKRHPLLMLLIDYINQIYDYKRPFFGVEWVTGPLAFTKALLHSKMPMTIIPREYFYAQFHYVPNPSAVDLSAYPNSLGFQTGYTCSNLAEWVRTNNRCRRALDCYYHSKKTDYPLGSILKFPPRESAERFGAIPKVIHQFSFSTNPPHRWMQTWSEHFCNENKGWSYKMWTYDALRAATPFFCANMYPAEGRPMDEDTIKLLALEILFKEGGYYVPLTTVYAPKGLAKLPDEIYFPPVDKNGLSSADSVIGSIKNGRRVLDAILRCYREGRVGVEENDASCKDVMNMIYSDSACSYVSFAPGSRFLGAGEVYFSSYNSKGHGPIEAVPSALRFAYDCQVPCFPLNHESWRHLQEEENRAVVITDSAICMYPKVMDAIAGFIYHVGQMDSDWDFIVIALEWNTGVDRETIYRNTSSHLNDSMKYFGFVVNMGRAKYLTDLTSNYLDSIQSIVEQCHSKRVYMGLQCFAYEESLSTIYGAMPVVEEVFQKIAGHNIPGWDRDETESHGRLLKGLRHGQLAFELNVDDEQRIMYRAFNDDGGMNCEAKIIQGMGGRHIVEYARVFFDHAVVYQDSNIAM